MWGLMKAPSACHSGWSSGKGSGSNTSEAIRSRPATTSAVMASVSTTGPRATFTTRAPSGSSASSFAPIRPRVESVSGTISTRMSVFGSSSGSSSMPWTWPCSSSRAVVATRVISVSKGASRDRMASPMAPVPTISTRESASARVDAACQRRSRAQRGSSRCAASIKPTASSEVEASCTPRAWARATPSGVMWRRLS